MASKFAAGVDKAVRCRAARGRRVAKGLEGIGRLRGARGIGQRHGAPEGIGQETPRTDRIRALEDLVDSTSK